MSHFFPDANGVDSSTDLVAGTSLRIPNVVTSKHNTAETFKPYNPTEVIGDTTLAPTMPKPKKKKCNAAASVVMIVVAVVATIFTAGAGAALVAAAANGTAVTMGSVLSAGVAAVGAGSVGATAVGAAAISAAATSTAAAVGMVASYAAGAVVGSLASQAVGKAMGVVDSISWKQAAVAGLTAGVASWAAPALGTVASVTGSTTLGYAAQGAFAYATNYVGSKIVGLDTSFSWKNMAASAVGSAIAGNLYSNDGFTGSVVRGQISAHTSAWMRDKWFGGGRPDYGQVAADAFGNSLADFLVREVAESPETKQRKTSEMDRSAGDGVEGGWLAGAGAGSDNAAIGAGSFDPEGGSFNGITLDPLPVIGKEPSLYEQLSEGFDYYRGEINGYFDSVIRKKGTDLFSIALLS